MCKPFEKDVRLVNNASSRNDSHKSDDRKNCISNSHDHNHDPVQRYGVTYTLHLPDQVPWNSIGFDNAFCAKALADGIRRACRIVKPCHSHRYSQMM